MHSTILHTAHVFHSLKSLGSLRLHKPSAIHCSIVSWHHIVALARKEPMSLPDIMTLRNISHIKHLETRQSFWTQSTAEVQTCKHSKSLINHYVLASRSGACLPAGPWNPSDVRTSCISRPPPCCSVVNGAVRLSLRTPKRWSPSSYDFLKWR
jgi:hypothetical protein